MIYDNPRSRSFIEFCLRPHRFQIFKLLFLKKKKKKKKKNTRKSKPNVIWSLHEMLGMKICSNVPGHMTKMFSRPIYEKKKKKKKKKSPSSEPRDPWWPWNLVHRIVEYCTARFVQMMTLGCPWPVLWHAQIYFLMLLHGWKRIQHIVMYFQACSYSAYPQHTGERSSGLLSNRQSFTRTHVWDD